MLRCTWHLYLFNGVCSSCVNNTVNIKTWVRNVYVCVSECVSAVLFSCIVIVCVCEWVYVCVCVWVRVYQLYSDSACEWVYVCVSEWVCIICIVQLYSDCDTGVKRQLCSMWEFGKFRPAAFCAYQLTAIVTSCVDLVALPDEVLLSFKNGFPWNWQELLQIAAEELVNHRLCLLFVYFVYAVKFDI